jgi:tRNA dimethylallyltransferase
MNSPYTPKALALMGPTASGKTAAAIRLCRALDGEVISVDSGLVYRGMDIGTAKPSVDERQGVPHHLLDILDPAEAFSTGQFRARALELIREIAGRGRVPVLAGGTMLYFNALFNGLADLPEADPEIRRQIDEEARQVGWQRMHQTLADVDPKAAARIHPNDPQRIQRALEVYRVSGVPISSLCEQGAQVPPPVDFIRLILAPSSRELLHQRIAQRFHGMLDSGLVEEVERLYQRGDLDESMPSIRAVGYRQVWSYLNGQIEFPAMIQRGIIATRQFAKRQYTWLRRQAAARYYISEDPNVAERMLKELRGCLR